MITRIYLCIIATVFGYSFSNQTMDPGSCTLAFLGFLALLSNGLYLGFLCHSPPSARTHIALGNFGGCAEGCVLVLKLFSSVQGHVDTTRICCNGRSWHVLGCWQRRTAVVCYESSFQGVTLPCCLSFLSV